MSKNKLIIYSNKKFGTKAEAIKYRANLYFDQVLHYTEEDIKTTDFFRECNEILLQERGAGYWLWKPYILLDCFKYCAKDDKVLYMDCGDSFNESVIEKLNENLSGHDICLTEGSPSGPKSRCYTKRDCFYLMDCDNSLYWDSTQIEAGVITFKPTNYTKNIFKIWFNFCKDKRILTDMPNTCGLDNFPDFIDHRHDQSILNNIRVKSNIKTLSNIRSAISCNTND